MGVIGIPYGWRFWVVFVVVEEEEGVVVLLALEVGIVGFKVEEVDEFIEGEGDRRSLKNCWCWGKLWSCQDDCDCGC